MTLFSNPADIYSHRVRTVLAEKGINLGIERVEKDSPPQDLIGLNPDQSVSILVNCELTLQKSRIIMRYPDERFPHPPLIPVCPAACGESRLHMQCIKKDWYPLMNTIQSGTAAQADVTRKQLREELLVTAPVFTQKLYLLGDEFSLVGCCLASLLQHLPVFGVELVGAGARELKDYITHAFKRGSFLISLTEAEHKMCLGRD